MGCSKSGLAIVARAALYHMQIHAAAVRASKSTASMGKFDKQPAGDEAGKQARAGKVRQKAKPVASKNGAEKAALRAAADKLIRENS